MTLDDVTLEIMESNQKLDKISQSVKESNEYLELTVSTITDKFTELIAFFEGRTLKDAEEKRERDAMDKQILTALQDLKPEKKEEKKEEKDESGLTGILAGLAITIGSIAGVVRAQLQAIKLFTGAFAKAVQGLVNIMKVLTPARLSKAISTAVKGFTDTVSKQFTTISKSVTDVTKQFRLSILRSFNRLKVTFTAITNIFRSSVASLLVGLSMQFDILKTSIMDSKVFKSISSTIKAFLKPFQDLFSMIKEAVTTSTKVSKTFSGIAGTLKSFSVLVGKTLGVVSKIFFPLTIILTLWDTVKGTLAGLEKEGIIGGLKGAITGLFNSLIFGPLDMIKSAVSWILGFFGFDKMEELLDSFSFQDMFTKVVETLFFPLQWMQDAITGAFKYIKDKFGAVLSFFGVDFGEEEELRKQAELAKDQERRVKSAGAVAIDDDTGNIVTQTNMINGVLDEEAANRALEARGLRPLTQEERAQLEARLATSRTEKEAALKEVEESPKFTDFLPSIDDITNELKFIGNTIWESMTSAFDSIVDSIKEVDFSGFLGDASEMASNFFKNILRGVLPAPDSMQVELPSVDTWFGKVGGGSINLNPIPDSLYEFAGINPATGEMLSPPSAKKAEALTQEMEMATTEQNQMKDAASNTTNVVDASSTNSNITNNTTNNTIVAPAPNPVRPPNSPTDVFYGADVSNPG